MARLLRVLRLQGCIKFRDLSQGEQAGATRLSIFRGKQFPTVLERTGRRRGCMLGQGKAGCRLRVVYEVGMVPAVADRLAEDARMLGLPE